MIDIKTPEELEIMAEGGSKLGKILDQLLFQAQAGVKLLDLDTLAEKLIIEAGGKPSFKTVPGYKWSTCLCVNDMVVHGIPTSYLLKDGDVLTIDVGMLYGGFHTDAAWAKLINKQQATSGKRQEEKEKFLKVGEEALQKAIAKAQAGNHIGHISEVIQTIVEGAGYSVVRSLVGHGVGRSLHEEPQVPGFLRGKIENTPILAEGMTIAIEVIYAMGGSEVVYINDDGWTIGTKDGSLAAVFETSIAIQSGGPLMLTKG